MTPWFIATERFGPWDGDTWDSYVAWSGLTQLEELVSLDGLLCPTVLEEIKDEYWPFIVNEDFLLEYFTDFEFLMAQLGGIAHKNVLCVFFNPEEPPQAPQCGDFEFLGYDLIEREGSISALTNCGGYPDVFANSELSRHGLLMDFERARTVQRELRERYPDSQHADCNLFALFRLVSV
ncbi:MAG: hypothetical protein JNK87_12005 [Bryobacterales bacterium]|nr:hypothetical protein [Bryobacterales bacterium]